MSDESIHKQIKASITNDKFDRMKNEENTHKVHRVVNFFSHF